MKLYPPAGRKELADQLVSTEFLILNTFDFSNFFYVFLFPLGQQYYLNVYTKQSQWELPDKPAENPGGSVGPAQVQCSHLLVKHKDSRRPSSWREENITRTEDDAMRLVMGNFICFVNEWLRRLKVWRNESTNWLV